MANRSVPASCRHPVDFSKLVTQTAKAFALHASITCEATDQTGESVEAIQAYIDAIDWSK